MTFLRHNEIDPVRNPTDEEHAEAQEYLDRNFPGERVESIGVCRETGSINAESMNREFRIVKEATQFWSGPVLIGGISRPRGSDHKMTYQSELSPFGRWMLTRIARFKAYWKDLKDD